MNPKEIESNSFAFIDNLIQSPHTQLPQWSIIRRMIHACGDPEILNSIKFSQNALDKIIHVFTKKTPIVCDVTMVSAGLSRKIKQEHEIHCFINTPEVADSAKKHGETRSRHAMLHASKKYPEAIYIIGNAPTALLTIIELFNEEKINPAFVIGIPVGFIMAKESKQMLFESKLNFITNLGYKGGSAMTSASANACKLFSENKI